MGIVSPFRPGDRVRVASMNPGERWYMARIVTPHANGQASIQREDNGTRGLVANRDCTLSPDAPHGATCKA